MVGYREALNDILSVVPCGRHALIMAEDSRRGHDRMGRIRDPPSNFLSRRFGEEGGMVYEMVRDGCSCGSYQKWIPFEEGLRRIACVAGALEFERPYLAPLCRFLTLHPRGCTRRVPADVSFILRHLSLQIRQQRHYKCESIDVTS